MAKPPKLINQVVDLLGEGKTPREIIEETGCSKSTVTVAKKRMGDRLPSPSKDTMGDEDTTTTTTNDEKVSEEELDEAVDSFIRRIKIEPDPEVMHDNPVENTDYECPSCGHGWIAPKNERQDACPNCGMEFE